MCAFYKVLFFHIFQVHGGTTEEDIEKFIKKVEKEAEQNRVKNMDTVVFFDEANTTDAIGLIKEIMCDRRIHGKSVSEDLKFIAACNPYRKLVKKNVIFETHSLHLCILSCTMQAQ